MDYESFEKKLIQQQNILIQQLEEQLDVYRQKDKYQELLIEKLNDTLDIFESQHKLILIFLSALSLLVLFFDVLLFWHH